MTDSSRTNKELFKEISVLKQRIQELEKSESERKRAEEALQESEEKYRLIFENAVEGIFQTTTDGCSVSVNPTLARIFGYDSPEDMMSSVTDIGEQLYVYPGQRKERLRLLDEKGVSNYEAQMYRKDGNVFWVSINVRLVRDDAGKPLYYEGFVTDITTRKQTEDALIEKTHFIEKILESTPNLIYIFDLHEQRNLFTNRNILKFLGYTSEQIQAFGSTLFQNILHPDDAPFVAKHHARCAIARDDEVFEIEYRMKHADGKWHWLRSRDIIFSCNQNGKGQQILGVAEDITIRKQLEDALRDSEEKFSSAFHFAPSMISISSIEEGIYFDINTTFLDVTGFSREEVIGKTSTEIGFIEPATRELLKRQLINDGRVAGMELQLRKKNGQKIMCIYHGEIISFDEKRYLLSLAEDITERKRAEEGLLESEERYRVLFEGSTHGILAFDFETGRFAFANPSICRMLGYSEMELLQLGIADIHPKDSLEQIMIEFESLRQGEKKLSSALPCLRKDSAVFYADITATDTIIINNRRHIVGFFTDVTESKRAEEELKCYAKELEDANTALRVFMSRRDHDQKMLEEKLQFNVEDLVVPYLKKLNETNLDSRQKNYLSVLESNLNNIVSPYMLNLSATYKNLTPQEIQIANLIRQGKNTKDIADLLCTSVHTIGTHRNNIRKKLKLRNSKTNLRSCLLSLS
jgi:PAS domain S-box-containing protein